MVKRRRLKDDGEDGEDEDYQPDEEELRAAHRARFNRNGPRTRGRQAAQMETAGQAETGDVDADATGANNTSEVQHQPTANAPQVRIKTQPCFRSAFHIHVTLFGPTSLTSSAGAG